MLLSLLGSRNFRQGDEVLKTFLINNVFHSGLYGTASAGKSKFFTEGCKDLPPDGPELLEGGRYQYY